MCPGENVSVSAGQALSSVHRSGQPDRAVDRDERTGGMKYRKIKDKDFDCGSMRGLKACTKAAEYEISDFYGDGLYCRDCAMRNMLSVVDDCINSLGCLKNFMEEKGQGDDQR
jgi:hypothetical protein